MRLATALSLTILVACSGDPRSDASGDLCTATDEALEACDGVDNDCDGETDEADDLLAAGLIGTPCGSHEGACSAGHRVCVDGSPSCAGFVDPIAEACDGIDNDCDGETDEPDDLHRAGVTGAPCGTDLGACRTGRSACIDGAPRCEGGVRPAEESCDGYDNDCDGETDEVEDLLSLGEVGEPCGSDVGECALGIETCVDGKIACTEGTEPAAELCDGLDNDCDGEADDWIGLADSGAAGGRCGSPEGECATGIAECVDGRSVCVGALGPSEERCDGLDNDCDGRLDEDFPGIDRVCGQGGCSNGRTVCAEDGLAAVCSSDGRALEEVCNDLDDDCDGETDEGFEGLGEGCGEGICEGGFWVCDADDPSSEDLLCSSIGRAFDEACNLTDDDCDGDVDEDLPHCVDGEHQCDPEHASPEICDGLDNDCDGEVDEQPEGIGGICEEGPLNCVRLGIVRCIRGALSCLVQGEDECGDDGGGEDLLRAEVEPNNSAGACNNIGGRNHNVVGRIQPSGDRDWFCFRLQEGRVATFDIDARSAGSPLDSYLYLWQLEPRRLLASNDDHDGLDSYIRRELPEAGRYAIEVGAWRDRGCPDCRYTLRVR